MPATKLENVLGNASGSRLQKIVQHAQNMDEMLSALQAALPPEMAPELRAANVREDGTLVVLCSSSAWAARLRYEDQTLLEAARSTGASPTTLKVRVGR